MGPVKKEAMEDAGLEKHRIDEIVLIHRIASIHKVQQLQKGVTYMRQLHMVLPSVEESSVERMEK